MLLYHRLKIKTLTKFARKF